MLSSDKFLRDLWYYAMPSSAVKSRQMVSKLLLGEPVLFGRSARGVVFALRDICPHRGMPLSCGQFDGEEVECCYHGWRFGQQGQCTAIPALTGHENIEPSNIRVRSYQIHEAQGALWIYMGENREGMPLPPRLPDVMDFQQPIICEVMRFPCFIDHAVIGLMDPAHGPFVHQSWWWRSRKSIHEKAKAFGPSYLGFTMMRHKPSSNSFAYKLLGGTPETEISFQLPGLRIEHIRAGKNSVCGLTSVTPISENETEITHSIYTNLGWLKSVAPFARPFVRRFLNQDKAVVVRQQVGLKYEQNLMLIRDSDTQARWYYQLKNEFARAAAESRTFENPVKDCTLRWRS